MPSASAQPYSDSHTETVPTRLDRRAFEEVERLIFTDFEAARQQLRRLEPQLSADAPLEFRVQFQLLSGFLHNQLNRYAEAASEYKKAIETLELLYQPLPLADAWIDLAAVFANQNDWPATETALRRAEKYLAENPDARHLARLATREGYFQMNTGHVKESLALLLDAERLLLGLGEEATLRDFYFLTLVLGGLGELHRRLDDREKSVKYFLRVLQICENQGLRTRLGYHYLNGGNARLALNETEAAEELFQAALRYTDDADRNLKANAYANLGIVTFVNGKTARALQLLEAASEEIPNPSKPQDFNNLCIVEAWKAKIYVELGALDEAQQHFEKALAFGEKGGDLQHLVDVCTALGEHHASRENFQQAFEFQKRAAELAARHSAQTHSREILELETRHELEIRRQEARNARLRLTGLQLKALRAQMNPHFLFNALNAIQGLITSRRDDDAATYLARFAKLMRRTLDYSDWETVSLETEIEFLENYLDLNRKLRFPGKLTFIIHVHPDLEADMIQIPTMIVQPFVENAIEHGLRPQEGGTLKISFEPTEFDDVLLCKIEDDGKGYNASREAKKRETNFTAHKSKGMEITRERLDLLNPEKILDSDKLVKIIDLGEKSDGRERGTRVEVFIPIMDAQE